MLGYQEGLQSAAVQQLLCGRKEQADPKLIVCVPPDPAYENPFSWFSLSVSALLSDT